MENYRIELPDGTTVMEDFVSDRAAIAYAVDLNHGCSEKVSVFRITAEGENHPDSDVPQAESWFSASRAKRPIEAGQEASRRGKSVSLASSSKAAATGIASNAPTIPSNAPPNRTATTVTNAGTATVFPMIFGTSR